MQFHKGVFLIAALLATAFWTAGCTRPGAKMADTPAAVEVEHGDNHFRDVINESGIKFRYEIPGKRPLTILQAMSGGAALFDYDADGNLDALLISQRVALYRGDGKGHFIEVTAQAGLGDLPAKKWMGCAVADYDNDGFDEVYISAYRGGVLLHNEGGKAFRDVTEEAGIAPQPWGTSCSFGDYDSDGRLDLFIGNYVKFGPDAVQLCDVKNIKTSCSPTVYEAEHGILYHNEGRGRFRDVTKATGADKTTGKVLGVLFFDADGSGRQSLYLADDEVSSDLLLNVGGKFKNTGEESGLAYTDSGKPYGGMGVDKADVDGDGRLDLTVGTFTLENKFVFINQGDGLFLDRSGPLGIAEPGMAYLTFGAKFFDVDNDGHPDILLANGYIADNVAEYEPTRTFREPTLLFRNDGGKKFQNLSLSAGPDLQRPILGRGLATGDFDNDGRMDALVVDGEGPPLLLHNESAHKNHYLSLRLVGTKSNRNGYGTKVTVESGGQKHVYVCHADGSYLSSSDSRVHAGLGEATTAVVTVQWPAGGTDTVRLDGVDRQVTIREGSLR